jgi:hypothetical protein
MEFSLNSLYVSAEKQLTLTNTSTHMPIAISNYDTSLCFLAPKGS